MSAATTASAPRRAMPWLALLFALLLAGCGGASLTETQPEVAPAGPAPARVLVTTTPATDAETEAALAERTAQGLAEAIVAALQARGVPAEIAGPAQDTPDAALLALDVVQVEEGSRLQRIAIGFGVGQSRLAVRARLLRTGRPNLLAFRAETHSGYRPGLVLPLGMGLGAGSVLALVGAAGTGVAELRGRGPSQDMHDLAEAIAERTFRYLRQEGWQSPPQPTPVGGSALAGPAGAVPHRG